jgi:hypothetical protein
VVSALSTIASVVAALLFLPTGLLFVINVFHDVKRWPGGLRPHWLPPNSPVPECTYPPKSWKPWKLVPTSSGSRATNGLGRHSAHWAVFLIDEDSTTPSYLTGGVPGVRWCRLDVFQGVVAIYQQYSEDRLYDDNFALVLRPSDVRQIEFVPGQPTSWHSIISPDPLHLPKLLLHTNSGCCQLAIRDPRFRRDVTRSLDLLATTLQAPITR